MTTSPSGTRHCLNAFAAGVATYHALPSSFSSETKAVCAIAAGAIAIASPNQSLVRAATSLYGGAAITLLLPEGTPLAATALTFVCASAATGLGLNEIERALTQDPEPRQHFWRTAPPQRPATVVETAAHVVVLPRAPDSRADAVASVLSGREPVGHREVRPPAIAIPVQMGPATVAQTATRESVGRTDNRHMPRPAPTPVPTVAQAAAAVQREPVGHR